ncbi:MAG: YdeI/OmpD-associated family protein [Bacteroidota bacterium]
METLYVKDRKELRSWFKKNHDSKKEIWLIYYKKASSKIRIPYNDAVEEAICFGWIDGKVKNIDAEKYIQRYTPRRSKSQWSILNIERAKKMIKAKKMTKWGLEKYQEGIKNNKIIPTTKTFSIPLDLKKVLALKPQALKNFNSFSPSIQLMYAYWINLAKREATRNKRIQEVVERSQQNKKPGEK